MDQLTITNQKGQLVADSRDVAEMVGKRHDHLIRDIKKYCDTLVNSTEPNFGVSEFFIGSNYKDSTGRELPCYLITKKGCDMVANKMTGEKGVLFTAAYVTAFEQMREHIQAGKPLTKKSEQELAAADKRAAAMLLNAKTRTANQLIALWNKAGVSAEHQALALGGLYSDSGIHLPSVALQHTAVTYDKGTIAKKLGIISNSGLPHAQAVGAIIRMLSLEPQEIERVPYSHNGHDGVDEQYTESVVDKVQAWLTERKFPNCIISGGKAFRVNYGHKQVS